MAICNLESLAERRKKRCLDFSLKSLKHPKLQRIFPRNPNKNTHDTRTHEEFTVNFAKTTAYRNSAIPYCQRLLNEHFRTKKNNHYYLLL